MLEIDFDQAYTIIIESFKNPSLEVSRSNCPSYSGFITKDYFRRAYEKIKMIGLGDFACVGIEKKSDQRYKIKYLAVLQAYRHQGYGRLLMMEAEADIKAQGGSRIQLGMIYDDQRLFEFYESLGYRLVKLKEHPKKLTLAFMEKVI